ncbi:MAG: pyridoxamine 5'-phosphate oxidase family protein [Candidatus Omnitrophica bacterium]|nr:pyridoxamine 5'-phosphate oxidase family protein [Candidatus Omnitrophota bacterium]MDD5592919.1 pyridoxamine 5'-phosphate oxidase family protein [Candidatus Omnitrophota bacterium]
MLSVKITKLLKNRAFISVATADFNGQPNAAPKFFLKLENNFIYLADYTIGKTWENLKVNPCVSLSFMEPDTLIGYQINGAVEIIDKGPEYDKMMSEFREREVDLSAKRIIEGLYRGRGHETFELTFPERVVIFKIKLKDIAEIGPRGDLRREKV